MSAETITWLTFVYIWKLKQIFFMQPLRCMMEFFCATFTLGHVHPWTRFTRILAPFAEFVYMHVPLYVMIGPIRLIIKSPFQEYSYFTFTVSFLTGQAISTVTSTREWSGGIVAPLWASSVRCGTLVDILRQTNQDVSLVQSTGIYLHRKERGFMFLHRGRQGNFCNQQQILFWLVD